MLEGHCCVFGQALIHNGTHKSDLFSFVEKKANESAKLHITEISAPPAVFIIILGVRQVQEKCRDELLLRPTIGFSNIHVDLFQIWGPIHFDEIRILLLI